MNHRLTLLNVGALLSQRYGNRTLLYLNYILIFKKLRSVNNKLTRCFNVTFSDKCFMNYHCYSIINLVSWMYKPYNILTSFQNITYSTRQDALYLNFHIFLLPGVINQKDRFETGVILKLDLFMYTTLYYSSFVNVL